MTPFRTFALIAAATLLPLTASAQSNDNRYGSWQPPGSASTQQSGDLKALLKDLNALIKDAEQARAADRMFIRDLKDLAARYENPFTQRQFFDDFADGNFDRTPAWSVTSGEYFVEQGYGLRSRITAAAPAAAQPQKVSKEQLAISILGAVLGAQQNGGNAGSAPQPTAQVDRPSSIETRARISNAFAATVQLSSWNANGTFEVAVTQGIGGAGYRIAYTAGQNPTLELVRVTSRGRGVIDSKTITALEDQKIHTLSWVRTKDGTMTVKLDNQDTLSARDASFRDRFDGLSLSSQGADVIVKSVQVLGAAN